MDKLSTERPSIFTGGKMLDIYLIRHAQSMTNILNDGLIRGPEKHTDLTIKGYQQAMGLGLWFQKENIHFNRIYTSDAFRAEITGIIIGKFINYPPEELVSSERLSEVNMGELIGQNPKTVYDSACAQQDIWKFIPKGGESYEQAAERIYKFIYENEISKKNHDNRRIAIVTHADAIRCILTKVTGAYKNKLNDNFANNHVSIGNASITEIVYDHNKWQILKINDHRHNN